MRPSRFFAALAIAVAGLGFSAYADDAASPDQQCLACHSMPGLEKPLADATALPLHIDGAAFAKSVHAPLGCTACHADVDLNSHPPADLTIASRRSFAVSRTEVCATCHSDKSEQWDKSVHAALVRDGDPNAPICTSCHSPHAVTKGAAAALDTVPCKTCHAQVFSAWSGSVHGKARTAGVAAAPLCFDCHGAHGVKVASAGDGMKPVCLSCHSDALSAHQKWLPNAALHFDVVACAACHAPQAQRNVDLVLYDNATQKAVPQPIGLPEFENRGGGLNSQSLLALLRALNTPGTTGTTSLKGRLTVRTAVQAHEIANHSQALADCNTCHHAGAAAFQSVSVSVAGPTGQPVHYRADGDILNSPFSVESVGGFYAIGGTRIGFLDILFVLALLGGIGIPVAHVAANWWFKHFVNGKNQTHR